MTRYDTPARRAAGAAALLVTSGLALAGCKISNGAAAPAGSGTPAAASSSPAAGGTSAAGTQITTFFPVGVGNTWVYGTKLAGRATGDVTNKMIGVGQVTGGQQVHMSVTAGQAPTTTVSYLFHPDGSVTVPAAQFGNGTLMLTTSAITWPSAAQLRSGHATTTPVTFTVTVLGKAIRETAQAAVQGGGIQTVTVPAGTYRAQVIEEEFTATVGKLPVRFNLETWVANGVGPVKIALGSTSTTAANPATVEELKSFTRG
ncbi:MAG TPA: hypothetical protein VGM79_21205 [Streptosporangiaceae bacterium]|jgi:hypothetical protein